MTTLGYYDTEDNKKRLEKLKTKDTIVESVIEQFKQRSEVGINKYGVTLDRTDFDTLQWIIEAQQEAMDLCLYLERLKKNLNGK